MGGKWDSAWTSDPRAIDKLAEGYYGCLRYGSPDDTKISCSDPRRLYSYGGDVWTSLQSCKPSSVAPEPIAIPEGDLVAAIRQRYNIAFEGARFTRTELSWAWEALAKAESRAPRFYPLLNNAFSGTAGKYDPKNSKYILITHSSRTTETFNHQDPISINIRDTSGGPFTGKEFFQQVLIHELGHVIHGLSGLPRDNKFDEEMFKARSAEGPLTAYSRDSVDEAFAELVSYFVMDNITEQPTRYSVVKWPSSNPFITNQYPNHLSFAQSLLGGSLASTSQAPKTKVTLDPGHGNPDLYKENKADENTLTLAVARATRDKLTSLGYDVSLTRSNGELDRAGYYQDLQNRINTANQRGGIFVSIHFDRYTPFNISEYNNKIKAYHKSGDVQSRRLGDLISQSIQQNVPGYIFESSSPGDYYLLNTTGSPTDCENGKVRGSEVPCNVYNVQQGLQIPGIIQEIFPRVNSYNEISGQVNNIAKGYCQGILSYTGDIRRCP